MKTSNNRDRLKGKGLQYKITVVLLILIVLTASKEAHPKKKRGYFITETGWKGLHFPPQAEFDLLNLDYLNTIEKPVEEPQEIVPPQSIGTVIIPEMPPPATPVNAAASNIPGRNGAVFLGSGSLGVVDLGNGAYALGSGSLGYSMIRQQPRSSITAPLFPPLPASPNLIPAAVPSLLPPIQQFEYQANGYEFLPANRVAFGTPLERLPRLKVTQQYATPTVLQLNQPNLSFGGHFLSS